MVHRCVASILIESDLMDSYLIPIVLAAIMLAMMSPVIGTFIVLRRLSMLTDTLAHAALLGLAGSYALGSAPFMTSLIVIGVIALALEWLRQNSRLGNDALLSLFMSGSLAISVIVLSLCGGSVMMNNYLFGSLATIGWEDLPLMTGIFIMVMGLMAWGYRGWIWLAMDEESAFVAGVPTQRLSYLWAIMSALFIVMSVRIAGVLLVSALVVLPTVILLSYRLTLARMIPIGVILSLIATMSGLWLSYRYNLPSGPAIVLVLLAFLIVSFVSQRIK